MTKVSDLKPAYGPASLDSARLRIQVPAKGSAASSEPASSHGAKRSAIDILGFGGLSLLLRSQGALPIEGQLALILIPECRYAGPEIAADK
jgi:hypothetical protein